MKTEAEMRAALALLDQKLTVDMRKSATVLLIGEANALRWVLDEPGYETLLHA